MRLITLCINYHEDFELYDELDQIDRVFAYKDKYKTLRELVLRMSYKETEEIGSSEVIIIEG